MLGAVSADDSAMMAGRVPARGLDLDDIGSEEREELAGERSGCALGELDDADARERAWRIGEGRFHGGRTYRPEGVRHRKTPSSGGHRALVDLLIGFMAGRCQNAP